MIQKENLLKLLLNKPVETPNENVPSYSDATTYTDSLNDTYTEKLGYGYYGTPYRIIKKGNKSLAFNTMQVTELEYIGNNLGYRVRTFLNEHLLDLYADDSGIYGLRMDYSSGVRIYLDYYEELSKSLLGRKISYDITSILTEVTGTSNLGDSVYNGTLKLNKSPIDSRFLIATSLIGQTYFAVIEYKINVGTANEYRYQRFAMSSITTDTPLIDDMYVSWEEENVQYAIGIIGKNAINQTKSNLYFYEVTGNMNAISYNSISYLQGVLCGSLLGRVNQTPQIRYRSLTDRYYSYSAVSDIVLDDWNLGYVVISRLNGNDRTELSRTTTEYMLDNQGNAYKNEADITILNDSVFAIETILTSPTTIRATFKQLIGNTMHGKVVIDNQSYSQTMLGFTFITNEFNLYKYSYQLNNTLYKINSVFKPNVYNGKPYLDRKSLVSTSGELYDITSNVVFARNLYNKSLVGDTINSIIHIPSNYLNENTIIREKLISETNDAIDDATEEIEKNEYEELYINFVDTFKVWDKNDKSVYQQKASYEMANQLQTELKMYVANFRVTNNDGTIVQSNLSDIPIVNGEGVLEICFEVKEGGAKTFEILDQNYDVVFATIDISNLSPGAYKLTEKVKVEG
jgi:hypothetical protein